MSNDESSITSYVLYKNTITSAEHVEVEEMELILLYAGPKLVKVAPTAGNIKSAIMYVL